MERTKIITFLLSSHVTCSVIMKSKNNAIEDLNYWPENFI